MSCSDSNQQQLLINTDNFYYLTSSCESNEQIVSILANNDPSISAGSVEYTITYNLQDTPSNEYDVQFEVHVYDNNGGQSIKKTEILDQSNPQPITFIIDYTTESGFYFCTSLVNCIDVNAIIEYEFIITYEPIQISPEFNVNFFDGDSASATIDDGYVQPPDPLPPKVCQYSVRYKIVKGELPTGFVFYDWGGVSGTPIEQDCEDATKDDPPSFTWFSDGISIPKKYPITIRAYLVERPEVFVDRDFAICVLNNWDYDRNAFVLQPLNKKIEECK
jgi:hypothetical protein